ncbi:MAG: tetratricopeptide repeat protein [Bacteroidales bacterium]
MKRIVLFLYFSVAISLLDAQTPKELWKNANNLYSQSNYSEALENYLKIEDMGYASESLFYNIGNSYFKLKEAGKSILYYERALKFNPSDKDLINNLNLAKDFSLDKIEEIPDFILGTWIENINYSLSSDKWGIITLFLFAVAALLLLSFRFGSSSRIRKISFFAAMAALLLGLGSGYFSMNQKHRYNLKNTAIVMKPVSTVRSSPDNSGKTLFILHEGTKVELLEELGQWKRVELADGRQGWIFSVDIEVI